MTVRPSCSRAIIPSSGISESAASLTLAIAIILAGSHKIHRSRETDERGPDTGAFLRGAARLDRRRDGSHPRLHRVAAAPAFGGLGGRSGPGAVASRASAGDRPAGRRAA